MSQDSIITQPPSPDRQVANDDTTSTISETSTVPVVTRSRNVTSRSSRKGWCWTFHKEFSRSTGEDVVISNENWKLIPGYFKNEFWKKGIKFWIFQQEKGEESEKIHYQGFIWFEKRCAFSKAKRVLSSILGEHGNTVHIEGARSNTDSVAYASKKGTRFTSFALPGGPWKGGTPPSNTYQYHLLKEEISDGTKITKLIDDNLNLFGKNPSKFNQFCTEFMPSRTVAPILYLFFGDTGTGKSAYARQFALTLTGGDVKDIFFGRWKSGPKWWFDRYRQQLVSIFDEMTSSSCKIGDLLKLLDWGPFNPEIKGGFTKFNSKFIIITTNLKPWAFFQRQKWEKNPNKPALFRRLMEFGLIFKFEGTPSWNNGLITPHCNQVCTGWPLSYWKKKVQKKERELELDFSGSNERTQVVTTTRNVNRDYDFSNNVNREDLFE